MFLRKINEETRLPARFKRFEAISLFSPYSLLMHQLSMNLKRGFNFTEMVHHLQKYIWGSIECKDIECVI